MHFLEKYSVAELSTDGNGSFNFVFSGKKLNTYQKETLFKLYEINGIASRYFEEVEQI